MDVKTMLLGSLFDKSLSGYDLKKLFSLLIAAFLVVGCMSAKNGETIPGDSLAPLPMRFYSGGL